MALATYDEADAQYNANCLYDVDGSDVMARLFIEACRYMIKEPIESQQGRGSRVRIDVGQLQIELNKATRWLAQSRSGGAGIRYFDTRNRR